VAEQPVRLRDVRRGRDLRFTFDGDPVVAKEGESIAAALLAAGRRTIRRTSRRGTPRGLFCAMGVCFDCVVTIDGESSARACVEPAAEGMVVTSDPA
jgi:predicted molibdopterin-dependent oxidoreductase YjgC